MPHAQFPFGSMTFVARTRGDPAVLLPLLQRAVWDVNRNQAVYAATTMQALVGTSLSDRRFNLALIGSFAALALLLVQIRNWYGLWAVLVTGVVLVGVTWWGSAAVQVAVAYAVTWYLLVGAPRAVLEMQAQRRRARGRGTSDADILGRLTPLPGGFWVGAFLVVCVGALVLGGSWVLDRPLL